MIIRFRLDIIRAILLCKVLFKNKIHVGMEFLEFGFYSHQWKLCNEITTKKRANFKWQASLGSGNRKFLYWNRNHLEKKWYFQLNLFVFHHKSVPADKKNLKAGKIVQFLVNCAFITRKKWDFMFDSLSFLPWWLRYS